jgi:hypothetical protein
MDMTLLSRDEFKTAVFKRDGGQCVICKRVPAIDAHHLIDRSLWGDSQGYYLENGVSLCGACHLKAEMTLVSCDDLRQAAGITAVFLPDHFYIDDRYDHWGNILHPTGMRIKGELFGQENVQRILKQAGVLDQFMEHVKFPRTLHFPWSKNLKNDDRMHPNPEILLDRPLITTVKLDGENTTMYRDYFHARSVDSKHHDSRNWVKALHGQIKYDIPEGWRICGENMYATHSIHYKKLDSYFYVFSIWDENNVALDWQDTRHYAELLGLHTVPFLCMGEYSTLDELRSSVESNIDEYSKETGEEVEGYIVRVMDPIPYKDYRRLVAKAVRKDHVNTDEHWMSQKIVPNGIRKNVK